MAVFEDIRRDPRTASLVTFEHLLIGGASIISLFAIAFYRFVVSFSYQISPMTLTYVGLAGVAVVFLIALPVRYTTMPKALIVLTRGVSLVALLYLVGNRPTIPLPAGAGSLEALTVNVVWIYYGLAIAAGGLAILRPAFAVFPAVFLVWVKRGPAEAVTSLQFTQVADVVPITEVLLFIVFGMSLLYWGGRLLDWTTANNVDQRSSVDAFRSTWPRLVFLFALASHFANYGYSAIEKLSLTGGPLSWLLENDPTRIMLVALDNGHIFYSGHEGLTAFVVNSLSSMHLLSNGAVLFAQLAAFAVFLFGSRFLILLTIFFDVMHLAILGTVGANFWPWIGLNVTILTAISYFDLDHEPWSRRILATAVVIASPLFFSTLWLGWYDTGANNNSHFVAVDSVGREYPVPPNYFTFYSYPFGHMRFGAVPGGAHFPTSTNGGSDDIAALRAGQACDFSDVALTAPMPWLGDQIAEYTTAYHNWILGQVDDNGRFNYDIYAHHFFGPAYLTTPFRDLDKRDIVTYIYRTESVCLSWNGRSVDRSVLSVSDFPIAVR